MPDKVDAIVLIDPIPSLARRVKDEHKHISKLIWSRCDTLAALATVTHPTTIVQGDMSANTEWPTNKNVIIAGSPDTPHMKLLINKSVHQTVQNVMASIKT